MGQVIPVDVAAMQLQMTILQKQLSDLQQDSCAIRTYELERARAMRAQLDVQGVHQKWLALEGEGINRRLCALEGRQMDPLVVGGSSIKGAVKAADVGIKVLGGAVTKEATQLLKWVPALALILGIALAIRRIEKGEYWCAGAEVVSGSLACIPVYGVPISLTMDAIILGVEIGLKMWGSGSAPVQTPEDRLETACRILDVFGEEPDEKAFRQRYLHLSKAVHPDTLASQGQIVKEEAEEMFKLVNNAWETIRQHHGWNK